MKACWILVLMPTTLLGQSIDDEALIRSVFADLNPTSIEQNVKFVAISASPPTVNLPIRNPHAGTKAVVCQMTQPTLN